jgi:hypothetical protein
MVRQEQGRVWADVPQAPLLLLLLLRLGLGLPLLPDRDAACAVIVHESGLAEGG